MKVDVRRLLIALGIDIDKEMHGELWAKCPAQGHTE